jgi:Spy/CpxP family protein refolding chaperone
MLKKSLLVLIAAGLITMTAPFGSAQDNSPNNQQPMASQDGGQRHGPLDPAERTRELTKKLNLTSDQQTKVQEIYESARSQMESLRRDTSSSQPDRHAKMMEIHKNADAQVRAVLDSNQQKKWDEMQARREQQMQNRQSPPPQQ